MRANGFHRITLCTCFAALIACAWSPASLGDPPLPGDSPIPAIPLLPLLPLGPPATAPSSQLARSSQPADKPTTVSDSPTGYRTWNVGENLLWSTPGIDASTVVDRWLASPTHRHILLSPRWRELGLGVAAATAAPGVYGE